MSLSMSLNTALSGLKVNRESLAVLSQNIANANNPNYSRKIISQSAVNLNGVGAGVNIDGINRTIDTFLQNATRSQTSVVGSAGVLSDYAERLQIVLGSPGAGNGLNTYITNAFNAFQSLAETPESSSNRVNAVNAAKSLTDEINSVYDSLQNMRFEADQEISASVSTVNLKLRELYDLNSAIASANTLNRPNSELLDLRDAAIREINQHLDISTNIRSDDTVHIYGAGGSTLLNENLYQVSYRGLSSADSLGVDNPLFAPINVYLINSDGERGSIGVPLATGGTSSQVTTGMHQGRIQALISIRDEVMPEVQDQIDMLASRLRDEVNAVHNAGSGFPGATKLTGTRPITAGGFSNWQGSVRFGLVDIQGAPIQSPWSSESSPMRPLTIDLSTLDAGLGNGPGYPDVQAIVNEFNSFYGIPQNKVSLGDLNNIQLTSTTSSLPSGFFNFDFDLENISGNTTDVFVTSISVLDDTNTDITSVTSTIPSISLDATGTYTTLSGSSLVTVGAAGHGLADGDFVFLPTPSTGVSNIASSQLGGMFRVSNVTAAGFDIDVVNVSATTTTTLDEAGTAYPKYTESQSGTKARTTADGGFTADLIGNLGSSYYDVQARVQTVAEDGSIASSTITYRVYNEQGNLYNKRYGAIGATGSGDLEIPTQRTQPLATARLVDANGEEIGKVNGRYYSDVEAFLEIETNGTTSYISIDSLDSSENGNPSGSPFVMPGTDRSFSHYFELNNFFTSNVPTTTGDTVKGSARNLTIENRILRNPASVSTGKLVRSPAPGDPGLAPLYSYERISGDDSVAQQMANLANQLIVFDNAGGLSATNQTLSGYAGQILGYAGSNANSAESNLASVQIILEGFVERASAISGVNLDEELANTIIYQNAYSASARVITVADELFQELLNTFR